jgi:hypothetical protein
MKKTILFNIIFNRYNTQLFENPLIKNNVDNKLYVEILNICYVEFFELFYELYYI